MLNLKDIYFSNMVNFECNIYSIYNNHKEYKLYFIYFLF